MKIFVFVVVVIAMFMALVNGADKSVCSLPKEVGPCRKSDHVFFYNKDAKQCEEFIYGGCHGNDNRFDTKELCEKACGEA